MFDQIRFPEHVVLDWDIMDVKWFPRSESDPHEVVFSELTSPLVVDLRFAGRHAEFRLDACSGGWTRGNLNVALAEAIAASEMPDSPRYLVSLRRKVAADLASASINVRYSMHVSKMRIMTEKAYREAWRDFRAGTMQNNLILGLGGFMAGNGLVTAEYLGAPPEALRVGQIAVIALVIAFMGYAVWRLRSIAKEL